MPEIEPRVKAALADRYAIERELGAGGMATVYLAHDLKHERLVAVKVLRPELAAVLGAERFLREIKIAANLSHPHILPLHDSGQADGFLYYVMPYIEGESLRRKLEREKQLPIDEALQITEQVASALDYAHRQEIVHRDIKPENVLLHEGEAMVADFGIALAVRAAGGERITETGLSLGTPQYMSPEQATGDMQVDARSDIYSLASVTYEMLSGEPPYTGPTIQAILAKLVMEPARDLRDVRGTVPDAVALAVGKALAKLPADRFTSAAQFSEALTNPSLSVTPDSAVTSLRMRAAAPAARPRVLTDWRFGLSWLVAIVAIGAALWGWLRPGPAPQLARFSLALPAGQGVVTSHPGTAVAMSPDGTHFVYVGQAEGGQRLYVRELGQLEARPLPGTEGDASGPFFSPDGLWVGFVAEGKLKKVALAGGPPLTIADAIGGLRGATWTEDDIIVYTSPPQTGLGLLKVLAGGGTPEQISTPDRRGETLRWPEALPGGRAVILTTWSSRIQNAVISALSLETGQIKPLLPGVTHARYVDTGHLLYGTAEGSLLAVPFDPKRLEVTGTPVSILENLMVRNNGAAEFSVSRNGSLVYLSGAAAQAIMVLVDRQGVEQPLREGLVGAITPRFSPNGTQIVVTTIDAGTRDVWVYDIESGTFSRLTFEGENFYPEWSPDGSRVLFSSQRAESQVRDLYWRPADHSGAAERLYAAPTALWEGILSRDGNWLAFRETNDDTGRDIMVLPLQGERQPQPFVQTPFDERSLALSPDDRWLAYVSNESGDDEVYVRAFPEPSGRWQISEGGGREPLWSRDGRELFYRNGNRLISVAVETGPVFRKGSQEVVLEGVYRTMTTKANYDIHPDGQHFVLFKNPEGAAELVVVLNWFEELLERTQ
jgi:serine/threonine-protein kinase